MIDFVGNKIEAGDRVVVCGAADYGSKSKSLRSGYIVSIIGSKAQVKYNNGMTRNHMTGTIIKEIKEA